MTITAALTFQLLDLAVSVDASGKSLRGLRGQVRRWIGDRS